MHVIYCLAIFVLIGTPVRTYQGCPFGIAKPKIYKFEMPMMWE